MKSKHNSPNSAPGSFRSESYWEDNNPLSAILLQSEIKQP